MKKFLSATLALFLVISLVGCGGNNQQTTPSNQIEVSISIIGLDGQTILPNTKTNVNEGENALAILKNVAAQNNIEVSVDEMSGFGEYVTGINGLNSGDNGQMSGWIYKVNDQSPNVGMGEYKVTGGENIAVEYTTSF
ncbi:MAG: DUF4430 domain-containing protein [Clostridiales bacterium]|jgi:hypothetical protein|nr:DUF4430 domain-containing protein [Clostridiales bacterium]